MSDNMGAGPYGGPHAGGPYGGGPYGGGPYGGAPGAPGTPGWGGWAPPPPHPGVIPLRPLTVGDILSGAFATMGRYKKPVIGLPAAVFGACSVLVLCAAVIAYFAVNDTVHELVDLPGGRDPEWDQIEPLVVALVCVGLIALVGYVLAAALVQGGMFTVLKNAVVGGPAGFGPVWRQALPRVPALIGTALLTGLIVAVPAVLLMIAFASALIGVSLLGSGEGGGGGALVAIGLLGALVTAVPAVWLWVKFSLAPAAVVLEKQGPVRALRRSSELVRGRWWPVFGISLLAYVLAAVIAGVIQQGLSLVGMFPAMAGAASLGPEPEPSEVLSVFSVYIVLALVAQLIGYIIQTTFPPLVTGLLYVDQRIRKEGLAPTLAAAAAAAAATAPAAPPSA
ncbi:hypothetical protein H1V43_00725 [Streptomyces sp. PSKA54]|uniref:DUF7847 domain-containing protein n=1 Tax=Streptomyces himalayensis subsp. aureolus TaxID=2758039 RepID=A0A7W2HDL8_9ACTN|nr:hypothetical protein [Streptomyces himalayensis]MBA4859922.1 hypothetical protein [Streptomyces himalayensis subsp. aureolus]